MEFRWGATAFHRVRAQEIDDVLPILSRFATRCLMFFDDRGGPTESRRKRRSLRKRVHYNQSASLLFVCLSFFSCGSLQSPSPSIITESRGAPHGGVQVGDVAVKAIARGHGHGQALR